MARQQLAQHRRSPGASDPSVLEGMWQNVARNGVEMTVRVRSLRPPRHEWKAAYNPAVCLVVNRAIVGGPVAGRDKTLARLDLLTTELPSVAPGKVADLLAHTGMRGERLVAGGVLGRSDGCTARGPLVRAPCPFGWSGGHCHTPAGRC